MEMGLPRFLPRMILKGAKGREVKAVQQALIANGYRIKADGVFGDGTQIALRSFQEHKGLFPSSVIDQETIDCLYAESKPPGDARLRLKDPQLSLKTGQTSLLATRNPARLSNDIWLHGVSGMALPQAFWGRSFPPGGLSLSIQGFDFIYGLETDKKGKSKHTHWPGGASGVTLGPGYDMRERAEANVSRDLAAIGVDPSIAQALSKGATKKEDDARVFAETHKNLLALSTDQQKKLLKINQSHYEAIVKRLIAIDLFQFEYDALVSFVYNPGASVALVAQHINAGEPEKAMKIIQSRVVSGGRVLPGLVSRRNAEIALYTRGIYG
jgi:GH24 family phage-related lysozyme (muramidase)